jgi:hypothetical protein
MSYVITEMKAEAKQEPILTYLPPLRTQSALVSALFRLGLPLPSKIEASSRPVDQLRTLGIKYTMFDLNRALDRTSLSRQRIEFKLEVERAGLLAS